MDILKQIKIVRNNVPKNRSDTIKPKSQDEIQIHNRKWKAPFFIGLLVLVIGMAIGYFVCAYIINGSNKNDISDLIPGGYYLSTALDPNFFFANQSFAEHFFTNNYAFSDQIFSSFYNILGNAGINLQSQYPMIFTGNFYVVKYPSDGWIILFKRNPNDNSLLPQDISNLQDVLKSDFIVSSHPYRETNIYTLSYVSSSQDFMYAAVLDKYMIASNQIDFVKSIIDKNNNSVL